MVLSNMALTSFLKRLSRGSAVAGAMLTATIIVTPLDGGARAQPTGNAATAEPRELVQLIQNLLIERGYPVGETDGRLGSRTQAAIRAFERSSGMPVTGRPSEEVYMRLLMADQIDRASTATQQDVPFSLSVESIQSGDAPPPPPAGSLDGSQWGISDSYGAFQEIEFAPGGVIKGTGFDRFWSWRQFGSSVQILFDNGFGQTTLREGEFSEGGTIEGVGKSSDGRFWSWTATRLDGGKRTQR